MRTHSRTSLRRARAPVVAIATARRGAALFEATLSLVLLGAALGLAIPVAFQAMGRLRLLEERQVAQQQVLNDLETLRSLSVEQLAPEALRVAVSQPVSLPGLDDLQRDWEARPLNEPGVSGWQLRVLYRWKSSATGTPQALGVEGWRFDRVEPASASPASDVPAAAEALDDSAEPATALAPENRL